MTFNYRELFVGLIIVFMLFSSEIKAMKDEELKEFDIYDIQELNVSNSNGRILITSSGESQKATVEFDRNNCDSHCVLEMVKINKALVVNHNQPYYGLGNCQVNFSIKVPSHIPMIIKGGNLNIYVEGVYKNLDFNVGNARIDITSPLEGLNGKAGCLNLRANQLKGHTNLEFGSGSINLSYQQTHQPIFVQTSSGCGSINLQFPSQSLVQAHYSASPYVCRIYNEFPVSCHRSDFYVKGNLGLGDINIIKNYP